MMQLTFPKDLSVQAGYTIALTPDATTPLRYANCVQLIIPHSYNLAELWLTLATALSDPTDQCSAAGLRNLPIRDADLHYNQSVLACENIDGSLEISSQI